MRRKHATGAIAGAWRERYRRGWPGGECLESRARLSRAARAAPGAGGGGDHGGTEITAVPTRAPGTEHASQTSHLIRMTQPGGDRPPPAPSSVKEGKHLMLARHRQSLILQAV